MNENNFTPIIKKQAQEPEPDAATRMIQLLQEVVSRMDAMEKRGTPATAKDVEALAEKARKGVIVTVDGPRVADSIMPHLQAAIRQIEQAGKDSAQAWAERIGFTSPRAFWLVLGPCFLLLGATTWYASEQHAQVKAAQQTVTEANKRLNFYLEYDKWLDKEHPKIWPQYEKVLNGGKKGKKQ